MSQTNDNNEKTYKLSELPEDYKPYWELIGCDHPIVMIDGVLRFKANSVINQIWKRCDLNEMRIEYYEGKFTLEDYKEFYRDMGVSLSMFIDTFLQVEENDPRNED